ncbi:polymeric immunoglobulin receptor-like [Mixophyes fleayi]|uniref:polymeric immunoglobulin receptor-like n=1 Tax=Mixophyes fleayi TaxID=3061075 RepID=UPI003F4E01E4
MGLFIVWLSVLLLLFPALISAYQVTGLVGESLVLPCAYPVTRNPAVMCWGRGSCSASGCNHPVAKVNGTKVVWTKCAAYTFSGDLTNGEVSLTLSDVALNDAGSYCCFVKIPGLGLELKKEITVAIQEPMTKDKIVRGSVGDTLRLPCKYSVKEGIQEMCWGKGSCGLSGCANPILSTNGSAVTWSESGRYQLLGNIREGDVSLTIKGVSKDEEGKYCCRVRVPGPFNDLKHYVELKIQDVYLVRGSLKDTLTLPCSYSGDGGLHPTCWGRGRCGIVSCLNEILTTDDNKVTWRESDKYKLLGNIESGNVSLTIPSVTEEDAGVYCCRVKVSGLFNDIMKEIRLQIHDVDQVTGLAGDTLTLPCTYNVSEGTTTMCWGRGSCPLNKCDNTIVWTDGEVVTWTASEKYKLRKDIMEGDVSLTIARVTKEDEGMYCCRVEIPGLFNDKIKEISLEVEDDGFQAQQ